MSRTVSQARRDVGRRWVKRGKGGDRAHVIVSSHRHRHRYRHRHRHRHRQRMSHYF